MNERRVKKAIRASYARAFAAIADAREIGSEFAKRVALETVNECRALNRDRRRALLAGRPVERGSR